MTETETDQIVASLGKNVINDINTRINDGKFENTEILWLFQFLLTYVPPAQVIKNDS